MNDQEQEQERLTEEEWELRRHREDHVMTLNETLMGVLTCEAGPLTFQDTLDVVGSALAMHLVVNGEEDENGWTAGGVTLSKGDNGRPEVTGDLLYGDVTFSLEFPFTGILEMFTGAATPHDEHDELDDLSRRKREAERGDAFKGWQMMRSQRAEHMLTHHSE